MVLIVIALLVLAGTALTLSAMRSAPDGFEDEIGFHAQAERFQAESTPHDTRLPDIMVSR